MSKTSDDTKSRAPALADRNALHIDLEPDEDKDAAEVKARLHPVVSATATMRAFDSSLAKTSLTSMVGELTRHVNDSKAGNMNRPEAMLLTQAHTLDVIFNALAQRAGANIGKHRDAAETYLRMALKAQSQCRTTLEALAEIKAPKSATFIKQANIAGQQQVNNGSAIAAHEKNITPSNELLESQYGERLDTRAAGKASGTDPHLETVGAVDRPTNTRRKGA
ncbi:MAG: hypothetical protein JWL97_4320 [Gemmatimonadales bacterium]|nr:hypothetical protein [Gemmatimonadales bacterium]